MSITNGPQTIAYLGMSLDGYIADTAEGMTWLEEVQGQGDNGYGAFYDSISSVVMGRRTYDWLIKQDLEVFPYQDKDCYLLTSQPVEPEKHIRLASSARQLFADLKEYSQRDIWIVGGGLLISKLIQEGLLDCLQVMIAPLLLGDGVPLFTGLDCPYPLELTDCRRHGQFVELFYQVKK
ncbi:dihydrofolate reductase family protein [Streptococcus oricebi]|uniref:Bacterial bifunctional deaminase-reductase C-terminal domain-containing protein n=1 Tax=Streptococcus oricebi TaxID=1547447 RepID=A0ABS5B2Y9_9STRE|nr:dihydrofolate reductase family protein [Streptococcus oricebi]MBP2623207.1 hypothetical protein [Streptococcus oricebi]